ncbi:hypothetical protein TWF481_005193 [Arthrobotrys musiformis]|uniref:Uncharacterized protein n=1 Tax=Arthrobotrys musiformis TaxID=47236 RepID=A0AAV9WCY4_9PEZI
MVFFLLPQTTSHKHIITLAVIVLIASTSLLLYEVQNVDLADIFHLKRDVAAAPDPNTVPDPTSPPVINVSPANPFDVNFDETPYRRNRQTKIQTNPDHDPKNTRTPVPLRNKLRKRDRIPISWQEMLDFMGNQAARQQIFFPIVSTMSGFLAELSGYEHQINSINHITEFLNSWRFKESAFLNNRQHQAEAQMVLFALRSYEESIEDYPDFIDLMKVLVGSFAGAAGRRRFTDADVIIKLLFMDSEQDAQDLDDEWLRFITGFFRDAAVELREWITSAQFGRDTYANTILELKSNSIVSNSDFNKLRDDVEDILEWFSAFAEAAEEAVTLLTEFREAIRNGLPVLEEPSPETPGTLPYTPGTGRPGWFESPPNAEGNIFNRLDNEPLTPPSNIQGDDYIDYLRAPPRVANGNPGAMVEEEEVRDFEAFEEPESNM